MGSIDDRIAKLEAQFRPPEQEPELVCEEAVADLDALAAIVRDNGPALDDAKAIIEEQHPELDNHAAQLAAKRTVILASGPDGPRLWNLLAEATDADRKLPELREDYPHT